MSSFSVTVGFLILKLEGFLFLLVEKNGLCFSMCVFAGCFAAVEVRCNLPFAVNVFIFMMLMADVIHCLTSFIISMFSTICNWMIMVKSPSEFCFSVQ